MTCRIDVGAGRICDEPDHAHCVGCGYVIEAGADLCIECRFPRAGVGEDT